MEKDLEGLSPADVGPIDNSPLLDSSGNLVVVPAEGDNAEYLPSEAWMLLLQWYGNFSFKGYVADLEDH